MNGRELPLLNNKDARSILDSICRQHRISLELLCELIDIQRNNLGRGRQMGITQEFNAAVADFLDEQSKEIKNASA